jgi:uncharacterized protein (UPF0335 family)
MSHDETNKIIQHITKTLGTNFIDRLERIEKNQRAIHDMASKNTENIAAIKEDIEPVVKFYSNMTFLNKFVKWVLSIIVLFGSAYVALKGFFLK